MRQRILILVAMAALLVALLSLNLVAARARAATVTAGTVNNAQAGQTVDHIHIHLIGWRALSWPPG